MSCAHHTTSPKYPNCPTAEYPTPACPAKKGCPNKGYPTAWDSDEHKAVSSYNLATPEAVMTDMLTRGTVTVSFQVYADFLTYKSGVYSCPSSGQPLGGHAVSILGWGTDATGGDYWIVRNSWNDSWGIFGTVWIARGTNTCGIESDMVAGKAV